MQVITRRTLARRTLAAALIALAGAVVTAAGVSPVSAQQSAGEDAVRAPIEQMFAGMKASDSLMIRDAFVADGRLVDIRDRNGETVVRMVPVADFARSIAAAPVGSLIERYWDAKIDIEANVASVWLQYDFHVGEKFSHCGIDAFQLAKTHAGWKIVQVMDTRRTTDCGKPPGK